jgi:DNA-binding response OmpR family regulator
MIEQGFERRIEARPFSPGELVRHIETVLRRVSRADVDPVPEELATVSRGFHTGRAGASRIEEVPGIRDVE